MRRLVSMAILTVLAPGGAFAADLQLVCAKADDERLIDVVSPGVVGKNCDVRYSRGDGANASVPYHADNSPDFCLTKAAELAETLKASGYICTPVDAKRTAQAPAAPAAATAEPVATAPAQPTLTEMAPAEIARPAPAADMTALPEARPFTPAPVEPAIAVAPAPKEDQPTEQALDGARVAEADASLEAEMSKILAEPPVDEPMSSAVEEDVELAVRGPAQLTPQRAEASQPKRPAAPVGRLVGATPDPRPQPAAAVTPASAIQNAPMPPDEAPAVEAKPAPAPEATPPPAPVAAAPSSEASETKSAARRKPADIVRATLQAQAAAWNEGNLDAFMAAYWKSDDLVFVSGGDVTKGWSATMKRYRERYADESGLGQLGFDKMDVEMVTDDVAVVTGRFNHTKGAEASSGTFSLVMRQANGVWRIVHDHTVVDAKQPQ